MVLIALCNQKVAYRLTGLVRDGSIRITNDGRRGNGPSLTPGADRPHTGLGSALPDKGSIVRASSVLRHPGAALLALAMLVTLLAPTAASAAPGENLLVNASLETDADGNALPDCWERGSDTPPDATPSTATYSLVGDAHDGAVAQRIDVTSEGGDHHHKALVARFTPGCAPTVTPGTTYELSVWYRSSAADNAVAVFHRNASTGDWEYWKTISGFGAAADYTEAKALVTAEPGYDAISFGLGMYEAGTLVTDDYRLSVPGDAPAPPPPSAEASIEGLALPTAIEFVPGGRVYVAEKDGIIKSFADLQGTDPRVELDIRDAVSSFFDFGLTALAYRAGFLYGTYTPNEGRNEACEYVNANGRDPSTVEGCPTTGRVSRWPVRADGTLGAEQVVLDGRDYFCFQFTTHGLDALEVGPDGALYVTVGEGANFNVADYGQLGDNGGCTRDPEGAGGAFRSQTQTYLDGSVFRLDPDTRAIERVARGLRNPFRTTFHDGALYTTDTGWYRYEEINRVDLGGAPDDVENFGWPCLEGPERRREYEALNSPICAALYADPSLVTAPVYAYPHNEAAVGSVTALESFGGRIYFGDYMFGFIKSMNPDGTDVTTVMQGDNLTGNPPQRLLTPVDLKRTPAGGLVYVDIANGTVRSVVAGEVPPPEQPPVAFRADVLLGGRPYLPGEQIEFSVQYFPVGRSPASIRWTVTLVTDCDGAGTSCTRTPIPFEGQGQIRGSFLGPDAPAPATVEVAVEVVNAAGARATDVTSVQRSVGTDPLPEGVERVAGADRIATAVEISRRTYAPGVPVAYVARADDFPDALAAGPLAAAGGGPILLTGTAELAAPTGEELRRLDPAAVVVLGGPAAVSDAVAEALTAEHGTVERLAGQDRYATAAAVAAALQALGGVETVYVATGERFPDALVGGVAAGLTDGAVLLTRGADVPDATAAQLGTLGAKRIVLLGGEQAASAAVEAELAAYAPVTRAFGAGRYDTAVAVSQAVLGAGADVAYLATGEAFPDALAIAPTAIRDRGALLLTAPGALPAPVEAELGRLGVGAVVIVGGEAAVSGAVAGQLGALVRPG